MFLELNPLPSLGDGELFAAAGVLGATPGDVIAAIVESRTRDGEHVVKRRTGGRQ